MDDPALMTQLSPALGSVPSAVFTDCRHGPCTKMSFWTPMSTGRINRYRYTLHVNTTRVYEPYSRVYTDIFYHLCRRTVSTAGRHGPGTLNPKGRRYSAAVAGLRLRLDNM